MNVEQKKLIRNVIIIAVAAIAAWYLNLGNEYDLENEGATATSSRQTNQVKEAKNALSGDYILALSWQPAFCEYKPNKPECRSQREGRFDTNNLVLHGLWPQPQNNIYCSTRTKSGQWSKLPRLDLSKALRDELAIKMPGYRSFLHRHEWEKHGTCAEGMNAEDYFSVSLNLLDQVNASTFVKYLAENIGQRVTLAQARTRFEQGFGKGTGPSLGFFCNRDGARNLVSEIRISLKGDKTAGLSSLKNALNNRAGPNARCKSGIIDPVGLQ